MSVPEKNISRKRRSSAEDMAKSQKEISVSEFFAKNRHLLGFDNPRKALLTTVKEAVDNSLDACEEAAPDASKVSPKSGCISNPSAKINTKSVCKTTVPALSKNRFRSSEQSRNRKIAFMEPAA